MRGDVEGSAADETRDLTFEDVLKELHALIGRWVGVAVYGAATDGPLAGFTGRLVAGVPYRQDDRLVFRVRSDDPNTRSVFFLEPEGYRGARWRESPSGERELLVGVQGGALGITIEDDEKAKSD